MAQAPKPGLDKVFYRVNFGQGLDTKTDPKVLSSGKMTVLQNAQFTTTNRLSKRNGFSAIGTTNTHDVLDRIDSFRGAVWGIGDFNSAVSSLTGAAPAIFTYGGFSSDVRTFSGLTWIYSACQVQADPIVSNGYYQSQGDSAIANGYKIYAWYDSKAPTVIYRITDATTDQIVVSDTALTNRVFGARCMAVGNRLFVVSLDTAGVLYVDSFNTASSMAHTAVTRTLTTGVPFDCGVSSNTGYVASISQVASGTFVVDSFDSTGSRVGTSSGSFANSVYNLALVQPNPNVAQTRPYLIYTDSSTRLCTVRSLGGSMSAPVVGATIAGTINLLVGVGMGATSSYTFTAFTSVTPASPSPNNWSIYDTTTGYVFNGSWLASGFVARGASVASKPFWVSDNQVYVWGYYNSQFQSQYILFGNFANGPSARILFGQALAGVVGSSTSGCQFAPNVNYLANNKYSTTCTVVGASVQNSGAGTSVLPSLSKLTMDFGRANAYHACTLNGQQVIAGGLNVLYDGFNPVELGFLNYPEQITSTQTTTTGALGAGLYQYVITYEYTDNQGQLHRSETSVPVNVTTTTGSTNAITLTIPTLRNTLKQVSAGITNNGANAVIGIYRTTVTASPAVFYRVNTGTVLQNTVSAMTVTYTDTLSDAALTANPELYTTGGILDNFTIDGTGVICAGPDRLFAADPTNNTVIRVGLPYVETNGLAFASGITLLVPVTTSDGPITAMQYMDSSLVVFYARKIFFVQGLGPTLNGQNNGLSQPQLLTDEVGCDGPNCVALYPDGLAFKSAKGYYRLGHDLSFGPDNYIGAAVESFNSSSCLRAICVPDLHALRFALSDNVTILNYDYLYRQWSTIVTSVRDMAYVGGTFYVASNTPSIGALVGQETVGTFVDALLSPTGIPFTITTGWFAMNQLQGNQRVFRIRFLGDFKSTHSVTVKIAYDYEGSFTDTFTLTSANITASSSAYQFEVFPTRQKCESFQVQISDGTPTGESFDLTDMEVELGVIPGRRFPLAATKAGS